MDSDEYLNVLQKYQENLSFGALVYQQDNAPIHKAKKIMDYFAENSWKILDWPAFIPDMNPIENIWVINKKRLRRQFLGKISDKNYYKFRAILIKKL